MGCPLTRRLHRTALSHKMCIRDRDYTAQWYNFRGSSANIAVTDASTPRNADEAKLQWTLALKDSADWETAVSDPIMVNNHIYIAVGNEMLMISRSGTVTARGSLADAIGYTCRPLYLNLSLIHI